MEIAAKCFSNAAPVRTVRRMIEAFTWSEFEIAFREAAVAAGFAAVDLVVTASGPVTAWSRQGNAEDARHVYLSAGIHGDEPAGPLALLELLRSGFFAPEVHWSLCPALNPTGLAAATRENAAAVDLNRDYWLRRSLEISAHAAWLDAQRTPDLFISLHEDWETRGFYFYEINLHADQPHRAARILAAVQPWFHAEPGPEIDGHEVREHGWIYHANEPDLPEHWPEAIYLAKRDCPLSFTFETPSHAALSDRVAAHVAAIHAAVSHADPRC